MTPDTEIDQFLHVKIIKITNYDDFDDFDGFNI